MSVFCIRLALLRCTILLTCQKSMTDRPVYELHQALWLLFHYKSLHTMPNDFHLLQPLLLEHTWPECRKHRYEKAIKVFSGYVYNNPVSCLTWALLAYGDCLKSELGIA